MPGDPAIATRHPVRSPRLPPPTSNSVGAVPRSDVVGARKLAVQAARIARQAAARFSIEQAKAEVEKEVGPAACAIFFL